MNERTKAPNRRLNDATLTLSFLCSGMSGLRSLAEVVHPIPYAEALTPRSAIGHAGGAHVPTFSISSCDAAYFCVSPETSGAGMWGGLYFAIINTRSDDSRKGRYDVLEDDQPDQLTPEEQRVLSGISASDMHELSQRLIQELRPSWPDQD